MIKMSAKDHRIVRSYLQVTALCFTIIAYNTVHVFEIAFMNEFAESRDLI